MPEEFDNTADVLTPEDSGPKHNPNLKACGNIILVPQPSDDARDPLNWGQKKKRFILVILTLASFTGHVAALANQQGFGAQAELYDKSLTEISYTISTAIAGITVGPLFIVPLTHIFGRCSILFWSSIGCISCSVWSVLMTKPDEYIVFTISRLFVGIFSGTSTVIGPQILVDVFFLHERGRVFSTFFVLSSMGTVVGPTLGGFIVQHIAWPWQFWWTVGLQGVVIVLIFFGLEETGYTRNNGRVYPPQPRNFVSNRIATYFPGTAVSHAGGAKAAWHSAITQLVIGISPVSVLAGIYLLGMAGWFVSLNTLLAVFLQGPVEDGGYGFNAQQNAAFSFNLWIGMLAATAWGYFVNDRVPLLFSKRASGVWKPEFRLHSLWIPSLVIMPIGLGLFGSSLEYHLHYMVLALGSFLVVLASCAAVPVVLNYLVECFLGHPIELSSIMAVYRLGLGLGIPFFINAWVTKIGVGWVFGMMAILNLISFLPIVMLMLYGHAVRGINFGNLNKDEEGARIVAKNEVLEGSLKAKA